MPFLHWQILPDFPWLLLPSFFQQSSTSFSWSQQNVLRSNEDFRKSVSSVRKMYEAFLIMNSMSDGTLAYPPVLEKGDINLNGMSFEVRYIDPSHYQCPMFSHSHLHSKFTRSARSLTQEARQQYLLLITFH